MDLILDSRSHHSFNEAYHEILIRSGLFNVIKKEMDEYTEFIEISKLIFNRHKFGGVSFIKINGKLIVLDTSFEKSKTLKLIETGIFKKYKLSLYVKYEPDDEISSLIGCKVINWVMFPANFSVVNNFKWSTENHKHLATLASGRNSLKILGRKPWFNKAQEHPDLFMTYVCCDPTQYFESLKYSKFGIILSIRRDKNTREYEFISNYTPMALNYCPVYPFSFEKDIHYKYLDNPDDLLSLKYIDPKPFSHKSKQLWNDYFRPDKAAALLLSNLSQS